MKTSKFSKRIIVLLCGVLLCFGGLVTAFAEGEEPMPFEPDPAPTEIIIETDPVIETVEPVYTIPVDTDPVPTEPVTLPPTEPPVTQESTTLPQPETEPQTQGGGGYIEHDPDPTEFVPPTIPKTVSAKSYSTNYAFGVISWICVIVGVIVVLSVAVSTKASGARARRGL